MQTRTIRRLASLLTLTALAIMAVLQPAGRGPSTAPAAGPPAAAAGETVSGRVASVADGDSFELRTDRGLTVRVRLSGIDAPEWRQPFGDHARKALSRRIHGRRVELTVTGADAYGRLVGDLHRDGEWINEALVADGWAWHAVRHSDSPALARAERQARAASRGLWRGDDPMPPWEWRRRHPRDGGR